MCTLINVLLVYVEESFKCTLNNVIEEPFYVYVGKCYKGL